MKLIGVGRLGQDAQLRYTGDNTPVANLNVAWNYGRAGSDGKRPTQWLEAALFGDRAEKLAPYLKKGTSVFLDIRDAHVETFNKRDGGTGVKLTGTVDAIEFAGDRPPSDKKKDILQEESDIPF